MYNIYIYIYIYTIVGTPRTGAESPSPHCKDTTKRRPRPATVLQVLHSVDAVACVMQEMLQLKYGDWAANSGLGYEKVIHYQLSMEVFIGKSLYIYYIYIYIYIHVYLPR